MPLKSHDHLIEAEQIETAFLELVDHLQSQASDVQLEQLLEKSKHESLNEDEKTLLNQLLLVLRLIRRPSDSQTLHKWVDKIYVNLHKLSVFFLILL